MVEFGIEPGASSLPASGPAAERPYVRRHILPWIVLLFTIIGCTSPSPLVVSDSEFRTILSTLSTSLSSESPPADEFRVSRIFVEDRDIAIEFEATVENDRWKGIERSICRRCGDHAEWVCSTPRGSSISKSPFDSWVRTVGLSREEIHHLFEALVDYHASLNDPNDQRGIETLSCLYSEFGARFVAQFDGRPHHATTSYGFVIFRNGEKGFEIDTVIPPPNWFEATQAPFLRCPDQGILSAPNCP
jgi:hypothetical protein